MMLSMCGWESRNEQRKDILECKYCVRKVGVWNYENQENKLQNLTQFDPLIEHKNYCPFILSFSFQKTLISEFLFGFASPCLPSSGCWSDFLVLLDSNNPKFSSSHSYLVQKLKNILN